MAANSRYQTSAVRKALNSIATDTVHGTAALSDPNLMSNLLDDLLPDARREKIIIVAAVRARLADDLREYESQGLPPATAVKLIASRFASATPYPEADCIWVTEQFALALGMDIAAGRAPATLPPPEASGLDSAGPRDTSPTGSAKQQASATRWSTIKRRRSSGGRVTAGPPGSPGPDAGASEAASRRSVRVGSFITLFGALIPVIPFLVNESRYWTLVLVSFAYPLAAAVIISTTKPAGSGSGSRWLKARWDSVKIEVNKYGWKRSISLLAAGLIAGVAAGFLISHLHHRLPSPTVSIATPRSTLKCLTTAPQCQFAVAGRSARVASRLQIFVLVFPVNPAGVGWYIQIQPAGIAGNGDWTQSPSYLGTAGFPAHSGDTLQIEAVLVRVGATYNGIRLSTLSAKKRPIKDPRQIKGLVSQSNIVALRVLR